VDKVVFLRLSGKNKDNHGFQSVIVCMALVTLTTDWQGRNFYSGMMRGRLMQLMPDVRIEETTHSIEPFHVLQAAFMLRQVIKEYPAGSIHLLLVNQGYVPDVLPAVAKYRNQYLVGWDDGILAFIIEEEPEEYFRISPGVLTGIDRILGIREDWSTILPSFPELSVFARIASFLAGNGNLEDAGAENVRVGSPTSWLPVLSRDEIEGQVIFIDGYGNAITNISFSQFKRTGQSRDYEIIIKSNHYRIYSLSVTYTNSEPGELLALFNSAFLLEIAIAQGSAADLLGLEQGAPVKIKFDYDKQREDIGIFQPPA